MLAGLFASHGGLDLFLWEYLGRRPLHLRQFLCAAPGQLETLAAELERAVEAEVAVVSSPSPGRSVFILQSEGASVCTLAGASGGEASESLPPAATTFRLQTGDALYVPGALTVEWDPAAAGSGLRAYLEIRQPTGADLLRWVIDEIAAIAPFRAELPRLAGPDVQYAHLRALRQSLIAGLRAPDLLRHFAGHLDLQASGVRAPAPPPEPGWIAPATRQRLKVQRAGEDTVMVAHAGECHLFPREAAPLLHYLIDRAPVPVSEFDQAFAGLVSAGELAAFLDTVAARGLFAKGAAAR